MNSFIGARSPNTLLPAFQIVHSFSDFRRLSPAQQFLLIDEHDDSITDGMFTVEAPTQIWTEYPTGRHAKGATLSFADTHVEWHPWRSPNTLVPISRINFRSSFVEDPGNPDILWLFSRSTF
jgi:hypothetical protein